MSEVIKFVAILKKDDNSPMLHIDFPYDVKELFGTRGNVKVKLMYDNVPHRGLLTNMGGQCHFLGINKELHAKIGKKAGDEVHVTLERDTEERIVEIPDDLLVLFTANPEAKSRYEKLSYTHRKEYVRWIEDAKKPETRLNRLGKTIEMLLNNKKNPSDK